MLKRFEVKGFKNFKNRIILDFSEVRDYQFNGECINGGLLNKIIVYGKNSVGKSNLGLAIFDITTHLTDKNVTPGVYDYYLNVDEDNEYAEFFYVFKLEAGEVEYYYRKNDSRKLIYEEITINKQFIMSYDYISQTGDINKLRQLLPSLNFEFKDKSMSILKYVVNNTISDSILPLKQLVHFANNMLWFRNLEENRYIGYKTESADFAKFIFEGDNLKKFQKLMYQAGVTEEITAIVEPDGQQRLYFNKQNPIPFFKVASNGTKSLYTLFYWLSTAVEVSFLFIDEFDAYYHYELSEMIVQLLEEHHKFQTILTSHNTNLLTNRIMRPDCYFILTVDKLTSLANATDRELREGHNLEKLYINGEFNE